MAFQDFLNHKCDVYHIVKAAASPGYGLESSPAFSYPDEPDVAGLACHFALKSDSLNVVQNAPERRREERLKLTLPAGADVRVNDKIIDKATGYAYIAEIPKDVHGHHLFVWIRAEDEQELL